MAQRKKVPKPPAPAELLYCGWAIYSNTAEVYRRWRFEKDFPPLDARAGDEADDRGPEHGVQLRRANTHAYFGSPLTLEEFRQATGLPRIGPWKPPREAEVRLLRRLQAIEGQLDAMRASAAAQTALLEATRALALSRATTQPQQSADPKPAPQQQNSHLRLMRVGEYSNGESYRIWGLLHDCPEIAGKTGDLLYEEDDDRDLTPFRLKRGGTTVGSPEWWQVKHLFVGLDPWYMRGKENEESGSSEAEANVETPDPVVALLDRAFPGAERERPWYTALVATADVPRANIKVGDIVVHLKYPILKSHKIRARLERIPRSLLGEVLRVGFPLRAVSWRSPRWSDSDEVRKVTIESIERSRKSRSTNDRSSPLAIVRLLDEPVSEPIPASSDAVAIFSLLHDVGCRPPGEHLKR